jgi:hypothetical protein
VLLVPFTGIKIIWVSMTDHLQADPSPEVKGVRVMGCVPNDTFLQAPSQGAPPSVGVCHREQQTRVLSKAATKAQQSSAACVHVCVYLYGEGDQVAIAEAHQQIVHLLQCHQ